MKIAEIKELSMDELKRRLSDEVENLGNLRFQHAASQLESPIKVRTVRRDIARIKTLIRQKELASVKQQATTEVKKA